MKKFTLFAFLVLFTSVFMPSCQKDGFLQEKPEIKKLHHSSLLKITMAWETAVDKNKTHFVSCEMGFCMSNLI
jgi:hypothetical protein